MPEHLVDCRVCGRRLALVSGIVRLHPNLATGEPCPGGMQPDNPVLQKKIAPAN